MKRAETIGVILIFIGLVLTCNEDTNIINIIGIVLMLAGAHIVRSIQ